MARKVHEIAFAINGKLSNSFKGTFGTASNQVKTLQKQISDLNLQFKTGAIAVDKYQKEYQKLIRQMQKAENIRPPGGGQLGRVMGGVGGVAALGVGAGAAAAGFFAGQSLKKAMDFEAQLSSIQALTGLTGEEMDNVRRLSLKMGSETKYSALEAAQGIEELLKAGMSPASVQAGGLQAALNLATAGGLGLAEAAEIMSTSMNAFSFEGLKAEKASNILAGTANASATSVDEMRLSLQAAGSVASQVKMPFQDVGTALGIVANQGLKGSDAGTSLKWMLNNLQPDTKEQIKLFEKLGWRTAKMNSIFYTSEGRLKSLDEIVKIIYDTTGKLSDAERQKVFEKLFGDGAKFAELLTRKGTTALKEFRAEMSKVTALDVAKKKMDNAAGAVEQFKGAIETLQIAALEPTLPLVKDLALLFADLAERYTPILTEKMKQLSDVLRKYLDPYLNDITNAKVSSQVEMKFKQAEMLEPQKDLPPITQTISLMWEDALGAFQRWLREKGQEQINQTSEVLMKALGEALTVSIVYLTEPAMRIGAAVGAGIIQGLDQSLSESKFGVLASGVKSNPIFQSALAGTDLYNSIFGGEPKKYARGGFATSPHLGMFGEAGPEAFIPLDGSQRSISLWQQTGRMLGALDSGSSVQYSFTYAPVIQGGDASAIRAQLQEDQREFERRMTEWAKQKRRVSYHD